MKKLIFLLSIIAIGSGILRSQTPLTEAIDFTATDVHGHTWSLFELLDSGQYVCIDFFFVTCVPCQEASPKINESYVYFGCNTGGVNYFAIDTGDDDAACIQFDEEFGVEYPTISGVEGGGTQICSDYQIGAYPTVILIAPDRTIVEQDIWPIPTAQTIIDALESHGLEQHDCPPPTFISEQETILALINNVYPSPATSIVNVEIGAEKSINADVTVFDMLGNEVIGARNIDLEMGSNTIEFGVSTLPAGTYFLRLRNNGTMLDIRRISISR